MIQATMEELRTAVAGQWIAGRSEGLGAPGNARGNPSWEEPLCGVATDTRQELAGRLFVALRGGRFDGHDFLEQAAGQGAAAAMVDRRSLGYARPAGLPLLEVGDTRVALGDLARFWRRRLRGKVVAVTGSSGKTTTRDLIRTALASTGLRTLASPGSFNNDIGVPLTVLAASTEDAFLVAEIGMNHPGEISPLARTAAPHMAVITMAGRAHIGGMGTLESIIAEKVTIVDGLNTSGMVFVNGDQPALVAAVQERAKPGVRVMTFGQGVECHWRLLERRVLRDTPAEGSAAGPRQHLRLQEPDGATWECPLGLQGEHNAMNALAAIAVGRSLGIPGSEIARAFGQVQPVPGRMSLRRVAGMTIYDDSYNANPDAMRAAIRAFAEAAVPASPGATGAPARRVIILGDMLELGDAQAVARLHAEVGCAVADAGPELAIFVGEGSAHGAEAARVRLAGAERVLHVPGLDEPGLAMIQRHLREGDAILLKGSRGSRMERLIDALEKQAGALPASDPITA